MRLQRCVRPFALRANANETFARVSSRLAVPLWSLQRLCAARWSLRLWSHHSRPVSCVLRRDTRQRYMPWCMSDGMYVLTRTSHEMLGAPRAHTSNGNLYIYTLTFVSSTDRIRFCLYNRIYFHAHYSCVVCVKGSPSDLLYGVRATWQVSGTVYCVHLVYAVWSVWCRMVCLPWWLLFSIVFTLLYESGVCSRRCSVWTPLPMLRLRFDRSLPVRSRPCTRTCT